MTENGNGRSDWRCNGDDTDGLSLLAGKIESLQMTNFMCHSNLELKFNHMINFITGRNGSGKSAIMAALIVVLGGSATNTGRGSGISDFIKKGENWARVSITLVNDGVNSFKRDVYGSRITITRSISKSGGNSYACKSETGTVVSKKRDEVDNIVLALNWQIKNPICVLNQDVARSFLCTTDNEMRFTMFTRATQLDHLKTIYTKTMELLLLTRNELKTKQKGLEEANQEIVQLKEKLALFVSLEKHVHQRRDLENEYLWSLVVEEENKLQKLNERRKSLEEKLSEVTRLDANIEEMMKALEAEMEECRQGLNSDRTADGEKKQEKFEIQRKVQGFQRQIDKCEAQVKEAAAKLERIQTDINGVKEHLGNCESNSSQSEEEQRSVKAKMEALQGNLTDLREKLAIAQRDYETAQDMKQHHSRTMENLKSDLGELEQNKKRLEVLTRGNKGKGSNGNLLRFGHFTQSLVGAVEEAAKKNLFHKKPVGPCGMHVQLSGDPKWARAVESVVGGLMTTYCCDNQKDFQVLSRIMDRICGEKQPTIIISKFSSGRHNVESKRASVRDHPSILDVLTFDNDIVYNMFIDQARIETIVLFETDKQAASLMTHIQNVPKNLKMGLTLASDQYYPAPNYRTYYGNSTKPLAFFGDVAKTADALKSLRAEMRDVDDRVEAVNGEMRKAREEYVRVCEATTRLQDKVKQLKQNERRVQVDLNHLKDLEDSRPVTITKVALEEELLVLQKKYEESSERAKQCREVLESLSRQRDEQAVRLNELVLKETEMEDRVRQVEERLGEKRQKRQALTSKRKEAKAKAEDARRALGEVEEEVAKRERAHETKLKEAQDICPDRVETDKSPVEVQRLLEKCDRYLKTAEKIVGSKEETIKSYKTKLETFKGMKKMAAILEGTMETLVKATRTKLQRLKILQTHTANLVSFYFQATLQTRGYDGQLKIDFDKKVLDLEVTPKDGSEARKDTKTLSGGERSYSTVSFILAIWKVVNMPVYFLDEFDVFMDKVNRKVIMDLLMEHASNQNSKQFVFITPQDISSIQASDIVSVYKLADPKRKASQ